MARNSVYQDDSTNDNCKYLHLFGCLCCLILLLSGCQSLNEKVKQRIPITNWEKLGPGGGGSTFIPTFSYHSPDQFLVRCDMTGSYLTDDGGNSYHQINFPGGAASYAFDPHNPDIIYLGSIALNRSNDGGKTWDQIFPSKSDVKREIFKGDHGDYSLEVKDGSLYEPAYGSIGSIRIDPVQTGSVYFSMGQIFFYSNDSGNTWRKKDLHENIDFIYSNNTSARDEVFVFTSKSVCIYKKSNQSFMVMDLPVEMVPAFSFTGGTMAKSDRIVFYSLHHDSKEPIMEELGHSEVWQSKDACKTWSRIMNPMITNIICGDKPSYSMISCAEFDAGKAYLVCNRYEEKKDDKKIAFWYGVMKTNDSGNSWNWVWKGGGGSGQYGVKDGVGVANLNDAWVERAFGGEYIRLIDVGVYPYNGDIAVVTDWYRTMKTMDGGKTWNERYSKKQPDGTFTSRGMDVTTSYGVHFDPFDSNHIAISYTDIGYHHSYNGGKSWIRSINGVPSEWVNTCYWILFDPAVRDKVWSAWSSMHDFPRGKMTRNPGWKENARGGVCVSSDGGKTWKSSFEGMGFDSPVTCIVLDPKSTPGNRTLYACVYNKGIFKSTDDGESWLLKNRGIEENTCAFELTLVDNGTLFVTISPTPVYKNGKAVRAFYSGAVYRSTDGAENWSKLTVVKGLLFPNGIDFDRMNPNRIYLACWSDIVLSDLLGRKLVQSTGGNETLDLQGGIFLSEDGGNTWTSISNKDQYVYDVTVDALHPGRLYCNTFNKAAFRSDDFGKSWKKIKGYDFHWGHRIVVDQNNPGKVYITTFGSGVWHGVPLTD